MKLPSNEDISKAATGNCTFLPSFIAGAEWMREIAIERSKCETLKQSPWIRPQDQMPKEGEPVLITDVEGMQVVAWWDGSMWHSENHSWWAIEVNYWMPIPEIV